MTHLPRALLFVTILAAAGPASAGQPAEVLLQASEAARQSSYQGVVVYRDARVMEVLRVAHRNKDGRVQERLTSLTGKPRDILHDGSRVACFVANQPVEGAGDVPRGLFPAITGPALVQAAEHYHFRDLGPARVAGRACRGVVMEPRDDYRYGYEICADEQTSVPLRVTLLDRQGQTVEQMMFTEVSFPVQIADSTFAPPAGHPSPVAESGASSKASAQPAWDLVRLPPGFKVVMRSQKAAPGGLVEHVLLSDGLSAVSVFGERPAGNAYTGVSQMGAMNAYAHAVGAYQVTVVGEVPQKTVRLIGDGFQPVANHP